MHVQDLVRSLQNSTFTPPFPCPSARWAVTSNRLFSQNGGDNASSTTPPRRGFISLGWQAPPPNASAFKAKVLAGHQGPITAVSAHPRRVEGKPWLAVSG